jgi:hypothetical protein
MQNFEALHLLVSELQQIIPLFTILLLLAFNTRLLRGTALTETVHIHSK